MLAVIAAAIASSLHEGSSLHESVSQLQQLEAVLGQLAHKKGADWDGDDDTDHHSHHHNDHVKYDKETHKFTITPSDIELPARERFGSKEYEGPSSTEFTGKLVEMEQQRAERHKAYAERKAHYEKEKQERALEHAKFLKATADAEKKREERSAKIDAQMAKDEELRKNLEEQRPEIRDEETIEADLEAKAQKYLESDAGKAKLAALAKAEAERENKPDPHKERKLEMEEQERQQKKHKEPVDPHIEREREMAEQKRQHEATSFLEDRAKRGSLEHHLRLERLQRHAALAAAHHRAKEALAHHAHHGKAAKKVSDPAMDAEEATVVHHLDGTPMTMAELDASMDAMTAKTKEAIMKDTFKAPDPKEWLTPIQTQMREDLVSPGN